MTKKIICDKCGHSEDMFQYHGWNPPVDDRYSRNPKRRWFHHNDTGDLCKNCEKEYQKIMKQFKGSKNAE